MGHLSLNRRASGAASSNNPSNQSKLSLLEWTTVMPSIESTQLECITVTKIVLDFRMELRQAVL